MSEPLEEKCLTCRFFYNGTTEAFPRVDGMCRRHAPVGPALCHPGGAWQAFPPMTSHSWCGEYEQVPGLAEAWAKAQEAAQQEQVA